MFRRERPQKGRYRQFHQINVELLGPGDPLVDAEVIYMLMLFLDRVRLSDLSLEINSLGCPECRPSFRKVLGEYLAKNEEALCEDCRRRLGTNPSGSSTARSKAAGRRSHGAAYHRLYFA